MAGPANPFSGLSQKEGATGSAGRVRGGNGTTGRASPFPTNNISAPRDPKPRGRGRGAFAATRSRGGGGRGASSNTWRKPDANMNAASSAPSPSPFAQLKQNNTPQASPLGSQFPQPKSSPSPSPFSGFGKPSSNPFAAPTSFDGTAVDKSRDPRQRSSAPKAINGMAGSSVPVEDAAILNTYSERYEQLKLDRARERERAIKDGLMADPNQPTSLNQAITPVGACTSMCPEFERVERIVQKMVDKSEKFLHPATNSLQNMELKMLKRFRRSAAGYDEQLPSDIRTPKTLLQTMNYLTRHVLGGPEPLGVIHKFVWDRTRSIRNDFSVQQVTQEDDVRIAVTCLERIARFHIASLHLLSSPANEEPFDRHQEREQLNNTMLSLMYYYDDNRDHISFSNEDEFRAYYIIFSIHDQRPDLEARVQKWPAELRNSPRVQLALELLAAAGNTWEYQGTLDARRPNAIAQGFYTRFFKLINSPSVSYLTACVAEIYFNHVRQTAIRSIWKGYCRIPSSQQHKNEEWTVDELTKVLHFDDNSQTVQFCEEQGLEFAENANGDLYLNWGSRPVDSVAFQPSSDHSFSEKFVESKRAGRSLVAIVLGLTIKEAANLGMIDSSLLSQRVQPALPAPAGTNDNSLFVSDDENEDPVPSTQTNGVFGQSQPTHESLSPFNFSKPLGESSQPAPAPETQKPNPFFPQPSSSQPSDGQSSLFPKAPAVSNPFAPPLFSTSPKPDTNGEANKPSPFTPAPNPFGSQPSFPSFSQPETKPPETSKPSSPFAAPQTTPSLFSNQGTTNGVLPTNFVSSPFASSGAAQSTAAPFSTSPFAAPTSSASAFSATAGQPASSIFDTTKTTTPAPSNSIFNFSGKTQSTGDPKEPPSQTTSQDTSQKPLPQSQSLFSSPFTPAQNATPSIQPFQTPLIKAGGMTAEQQTTGNSFGPAKSEPQGGSFNFSTSQPPTSNVEEQKPPAPEQKTSSPFGGVSQPPDLNSTPPKPTEPEVTVAPTTEEPPASQPVDDATSSDVKSTSDTSPNSNNEVDRRQSWIESLREAADRRRHTLSSSRKRGHDEEEDSTSRKRVHDDEEPPAHVDSNPPKTAKSEASQPEKPVRPRKSMALSSIKPLPKLPILERVEQLIKKPAEEKKPEPPKPREVDEDEKLLSAARIAAESLRSGPRLLDGWDPTYEPRRWSRSSHSTPQAFSRSLSPRSSSMSASELSQAPDPKLGLGRSLSRTEQRLRQSGGHGFAYKPLDLTPSKKRKSG